MKMFAENLTVAQALEKMERMFNSRGEIIWLQQILNNTTSTTQNERK